MRIALVQTNPSLSAVASNISKAHALLNCKISRQPDLIVFPELTLTGYNFQSATQITPYVETKGLSPSREFARNVAAQFNSSVLIGFPWQDTHRYNAAALFDSNGGLIHEYYKHHLFDTDVVWGCQAGPAFSFTTLSFDGKPVRTTVGICMDLNPKDFVAPWDAFEFANYILQNDIRLILIPMAWLLHHNEDPNSLTSSEDNKLYWIRRLEPLISDEKLRIVVICNRTGEEDGAVYAGTSCVIRFGKGEVIVLGKLDRREGVLIVDVTL
jgi:protein N-terminal amidase